MLGLRPGLGEGGDVHAASVAADTVARKWRLFMARSRQRRDVRGKGRRWGSWAPLRAFENSWDAEDDVFLRGDDFLDGDVEASSAGGDYALDQGLGGGGASGQA